MSAAWSCMAAASSTCRPRTEPFIDALIGGAHASPLERELRGLSERTVETHLAAAYRKLGVRSRAELSRL
ncbi:MAG: LuxR C-terminal-related transcriptional regulator [Candidatus Cybelea sp.]